MPADGAKRLDRILRESGYKTSQEWYQRLWQRILAVDKIGVPHVFEVGSQPALPMQMGLQEANRELVSLIAEFCPPDLQVYVLFDRLDDGDDGSDDYDSMIVGLLRAAKGINSDVDLAGLMVHATAFLRTDIYELLVYNDKNKDHAMGEFIEWTNDSLGGLIDHRMGNSLGLPAEEAWGAVFDTDGIMRSRRSKRDFILGHTFLRTRDVVYFCAKAVEFAVTRGRQKVENEDVYDAERDYSGHIYRELLDEMAKVQPGIIEILETIRAVAVDKFTAADFDRVVAARIASGAKIPQAEETLQMIFGLGLVGVYKVGGSARGSKVDYAYNTPNLVLDRARRLRFHPALRHHFGLLEAQKPKRKKG